MNNDQVPGQPPQEPLQPTPPAPATEQPAMSQVAAQPTPAARAEPVAPQPAATQLAQPAPVQSAVDQGAPQSSEQAVPADQATPTATQPVADTDPEVSVSWTAMEDIPKDRPKWWYVVFVIAALALLALAIFIFKSWTFAILIPVMAVAVLIFAFKPGNPVHHTISSKGVYVGDKLHDFSEFRAFGVMKDHGHDAVMLLPVKRFSPGLVLYFDEEYGERIVDLLGARLPMQEVKPDAIENFVRFIRL